MAETFHVPRRASTIAMLLFLAALAMLFFASLFGYVLIRVTHPEFAYGSVVLPKSLLVSTLLMLASSYTIHRAMVAVRREKQQLFRTYLTATIVFATLFILVQTPAMVKLWQEQVRLTAEFNARPEATQPVALPRPTNTLGDEIIPGQRSVPFYGLVMVLIAIHALHVLGGLVALGIVSYYGYLGRYDHEHYGAVRNSVLYWHFLDVVWIIMFAVIGAFG